MKVTTRELLDATTKLLQHIEDSGQREIEIDEDFYWDIPLDRRYDPYSEPTGLTLGQLSDDWSEITKMIEGRSEPLAYGLVWLASVMRRVGEKAIG